MLFNSFDFLIFIVIVFSVYWLFEGQKVIYQNIILLIASYVFYGWWDYRFLGLIFLTTVVDFILGRLIFKENCKKLKKQYLITSVLFNLGVLAYFKYSNFFIDSWVDLLHTLGYTSIDPFSLNIILPVGISFYTFQTMSYTIDIFKKKLKPTNNFIVFASFISFFPQLVAGPIERARDILPQLEISRRFSYENGINGVLLILWGLFKKVVIADTLAINVNDIYLNYSTSSGGDLLLGVVYFSFQIYCDFSGYSDIAIGVARIFGVKLSTNFFFPYFSKDINQFWKRWHISLTSWFRDYLYIPMGGSRVRNMLLFRNIFIVFIVSGLWHGANWTFVLWGFIHFLFFAIHKYYFSKKNAFHISVFSTTITYLAILIGWTFFRSTDIYQGIYILKEIATDFSFPTSRRFNLIFIFIFIFLETRLYCRHIEKNKWDLSFFNHKGLNLVTYYFLLIMMLNASNSNHEFIYFQF